MDINVLRKIGSSLLREISKPEYGATSQQAIGRGASGDKTFPIDKKAEEIIFGGLEATGKSLTIVSEEAGVIDIRGGGVKVLIDPIDGSKNAVSGIPFYCTSIAVSEGERIKDIYLSYIINLITGDEFWAERGKGAFMNAQRLSTQKDDIFYLTAYEAQTPGKDIESILPLLSKSHKTRCLGATALDLAYLAMGSISVFVNPSLSRSFDFGGGFLMVKEAGGIFTDMKGKSIEEAGIGLKKSTSLLASGNIKLHENALKALK